MPKSDNPGERLLAYRVVLYGEAIAAFPTIRDADLFARQQIIANAALGDTGYQIGRFVPPNINCTMIRYYYNVEGITRFGASKTAAKISGKAFAKICRQTDALDKHFGDDK